MQWKRQLLFDSESDIQKEILRTIRDNEIPRIWIFCTTIRSAHLSTAMKVIPEETDIRLFCTQVLGSLDLSEVEISSRVNITDCFIGEIKFDQSTLKKDLWIKNSLIYSFKADSTIFNRSSRFVNMIFGRCVIRSSEFRNQVRFHGAQLEDTPIRDVREKLGDRICTFEETADFMGTEFHDGALFDGAVFEEAALFGHTLFREGGSFYDISASIGVDFNNSEFHGHTTFEGSKLGIAAFLDSRFEKSVSFEGSTLGNDYSEVITRIETGKTVSAGMIHKAVAPHRRATRNEFVEHYTEEMGIAAAIFNRVVIEGRLNMNNTHLRGNVRSEYAEFSYVELRFSSPFETATNRFLRSEIRDGIINIDRPNCYIELQNATIGAVEIKSDERSNPFANLYIDNTSFDGFEFSDYRKELDDVSWKIDGAFVGEDHLSPTRREATYSKAKAGAARLGDRTAESMFSILEGRYRRKRYWNTLQESSSLRSTLAMSYRYLVNGAYDVLSKYGESPQRVFGWSVFSTLIFSVIYNTWGDWPASISVQVPLVLSTVTLNYSLESYILSIQSFTSFIVGQSTRSLDTWMRLTASAESFVGAFLIALFVATVVRKIET